MKNFTVALSRLFLRPPTKCQVRFAWWFVKGGDKVWEEHLLTQGMRESSSRRIVSATKRRNEKLLEIWDTQVYREWVAGEGPGGEPASFQDLAVTTASVYCKRIPSSYCLMEFK